MGSPRDRDRTPALPGRDSFAVSRGGPARTRRDPPSLIFGNQIAEVLNSGFLPPLVQEGSQPPRPGSHRSPVRLRLLEDANLVVIGGTHSFVGAVDLLEQFFAGPKSSELDVDVLIWHQSGQADHVGRQIYDA